MGSRLTLQWSEWLSVVPVGGDTAEEYESRRGGQRREGQSGFGWTRMFDVQYGANKSSGATQAIEPSTDAPIADVKAKARTEAERRQAKAEAKRASLRG